jgi:hypothetical protein
MHQCLNFIWFWNNSTQSSLFITLQVHSICFGCQPHPSSGAHKTVTTVSGTGHILCPVNSLQKGQAASTTPIKRSTQNRNYSLRYCAATSLQRGQAWPRWREVAAQKIWPVPEAVVTVLCTPDDGCGWHPKHVEWNCRIINRLLCVASRWTVIDIGIEHFEPSRVGLKTRMKRILFDFFICSCDKNSSHLIVIQCPCDWDIIPSN